ncbi:MAG TPA: sigma-70 family RNA polymerase sigma factor [Thermoanaerobaculia bacterium]|nr:sigma-70 family RNA polymerase sigma factor [Thermoanaerobaculia bacterium]
MKSLANLYVMPNPEPPSDRDLIARTLGGDDAAFALLVERFQRKIFRVALAITRDETEADTITQDTFIQAFTHLARFEGRAELETWLTRIAINRSRDWLRRRKFISLFGTSKDSDRERMMLEPADERPDAERQFASRQLRAAITAAEQKLSAQQKVIFRLRHYENLALEEIAEHLGLASGTVRAHLFRAIQKVRKELACWRTAPTQETPDEALQ